MQLLLSSAQEVAERMVGHYVCEFEDGISSRDDFEKCDKVGEREREGQEDIAARTPLRVIVHLCFPRLFLTNDDDETVGMAKAFPLTYRYLFNNASTVKTYGYSLCSATTAAAAKMRSLIGRKSDCPSIRHSNAN